MTIQICITCHEEKPSSDFWRQRQKLSGFQAECKACMRLRNQAWHENNRIRARQRNQVNTRRSRTIHPIVGVLAAAKSRAKMVGMPFSLTFDDIIVPKKCPILGIPLISGHGSGSGRSDFSPSIDRIDNSLGYTPDNIVIISWRANRIKNDSTLDELRKIVRFYERKARRASESAREGGGLPTFFFGEQGLPLSDMQRQSKKEADQVHVGEIGV